MTGSEKSESEVVSPTAFMRQLRPEFYSDSKIRSAYQLDKATLEYHLETITSRNKTHEFEIFCRKLCERTVCPNLRPATGPEGGGDSKADTETIPIADEVTTLYFSGEGNSGKERWAFAFSAKGRWKDKARSDVTSAIGTERGYQKIYFVTSQFARGQTRSNLEDELSRQHGVQVTILDRSWIVEQVIDNEHKDLAVNYLGVGSELVEKNHLGPEDYARAQQLDALEKQLSDPTEYEGMRIERVTDALVAAKLSRGLERPRVETDGRFVRAIRLAKAEGTHWQELEAEYESIWTAYWWHDDITLVNGGYGTFEARVLPSDHAKELWLLSNLLQLLFNSVRHRHLTFEEASLDERATSLAARLESLTNDNLRPNNALEARVALLAIRVNQAVMAENASALSAIWPQYSKILREAKGLGEFDAQRLTKLIEAFGVIAADDNNDYEQLVDDLAAFVSERTSEAQGALVLLRRARQLDFDRNFEIIRLLGRAVPHLSKKEHTDALIEAARLQALAYRSAGLLWAARANGLLALATIFIQAEEESDLPAAVVPTIMLLAWIAIELKYFPDAFDAIRLARGAAASLPLTEESKTYFEERLSQFDMVVSSVIVSLKDDQLNAMTQIPDALIRLGLPLSRMWLLYVLGYESELRADGWIQDDDSVDGVAELAGKLADQSDPAHRRRPTILNGDGVSLHSTSLLGVQFDVRHNGTDASILAAELVLTSLEATFATLPEREVIAHTERFEILIKEDLGIATATFAIDTGKHSGVLWWPQGRNPAEMTQNGVQNVVLRLVASVLMTTCVSKDMTATIKCLVEEDSMLDRIVPLATNANSRQRVFNVAVPRLAEWDALGKVAYGIKQSRPHIKPMAHATDVLATEGNAASSSDGIYVTNDHRKIRVHSIIDSDLWDRANWAGTAFLVPANEGPPILALMFRNGDVAREIFERWRSRVGMQDEHNTIYIGIVQGVSETHPAHYRLVVTSLPPKDTEPGVGRQVVVASRSKTMEPATDENLTRFLAGYREGGAYLLVPAILGGGSHPEFVLDLGILKRELIVRREDELDPEDFESVVLSAHRIHSDDPSVD